MKKTLICIVLAITALFGAYGCSGKGGEQTSCAIYAKNKDETAFGVTHKKYLGYMRGVTDNNGCLTLLVIDEVFMPVDWAKVNSSDAESVNVSTVSVNGVAYAKYIYVGDVKYTCENVSNAAVYKNGTKDITEVFTDSAMAKDYKDNAEKYMINKTTDGMAFGGGDDGATKVAIGSGSGKLAMAAGAATGAGYSFFKRESGYWGNRAVGLGIAGNYDEIERYLREYGLNYSVGKNIEKNSDNYWKVGDVVTGATLTDFQQYIDVAVKLYEKIK